MSRADAQRKSRRTGKKKCGNAQPLAPKRRGKRTRGCGPEVATSRRPTPDKAAAASARVFPEPPRRPRKMSQLAPAFFYGLRRRLFSLIPSQTVAGVRHLREIWGARWKMESLIQTATDDGVVKSRRCGKKIGARNRKSKQGKNKWFSSRGESGGAEKR